MNKYDLSVLIPARNEQFLSLTVENVLKNKRGKTEVIVVLDGEWAEPGIPDHQDVTIIYFPESIGQRAATNQAARLSKAKYVMKLDAHCVVDEGFDTKLMADMQDDWTVIPTMYNLHAFDWVCAKCGSREYQGPSQKFKKCSCGAEREKEILFKPRFNRRSYYYRFDSTLHFQYFGELGNRPESQGDIVPSMSVQGSCFFLTREKYWELNICDESHGGWGNQGTEVACATWLSGGQVMINKKTWYSHLFRTQGGDFGFPYPLSGKEVDKARNYSRDIWFNNKHPKQIRPLSWLVEKFWPVPGWTEEDLARVKEAGAIFSSTHPFTDSTNSLNPSASVNESGISEGMSSSTVDQSTSKHIISMGNELEVEGIAATPVTTDKVIEFGSTFTNGKGRNEPSIQQTMDTNSSTINPAVSSSLIKEKFSVSSMVDSSIPDPALSSSIKRDLREDASKSTNINVLDSERRSHGISVQQNMVNVNKGIIFYTDNQLKLKYAHAVQKQLKTIGLPITSVSLKPMPHMGHNFYLSLKRGMETYFKQILLALESSKEDIVYMCEHDVLYHKSHFDFTPTRQDTFYYNQNFWRIRPEVDNLAVHWDANQVSGLVCYRKLLLDWYKKKWVEVQSKGFNRSYEPGGRDKSKYEVFKSEYPNIDIRHSKNLTKSKWSLNDFRDKSTSQGWMESTVDKIPGWNVASLPITSSVTIET